jgi:CheY-like chemotaxis protein
VNFVQLLAGMEELLKRAVGHGIQCQSDFPRDLPPALADANQLELALLNLALNARDAMPGGGVFKVSAQLARVEARASGNGALVPGEYIRITIADSGTGMDAATLAKATEPFFTTKGPGKGTGLGLSMVHGLAAQSGGLLQIDSEPGAGTRVVLWLPRATTVPTMVSKPGEIDQTAPPSKACTVLIVDDDALVMTGTTAMIQDLGHSTIEAHSANEALTILASGQRVDLLFTDHAMPGMTGMQLAVQVQQQYPGMPIVLATGYAELPTDPASLGIARLAKPCTQQEIASAIHSALRSVPSQPNRRHYAAETS